ncbi:uncharacterized protein LOC111632718 [Centruroides sculpturatus]|uniref:uncharacterized protein LOC111632718 n=1 Tax=Centruroides sculpturatus TaxID=218467 RepID=UPI000C6D0C58|nr:uncharacterized protein LOC111632718 [Centruroides sculpturatus]
MSFINFQDPSLVIPKIITEDVDKMAADNDCYLGPPSSKNRTRSLSGGTYRLAPLPLRDALTNRMRRQSGDDVLTGISPSRRAALLDAFRPRSKSDSKSKRPTFIATLKNSLGNSSPKNSTQTLPASNNHLDPFAQAGDFKRPRSGSESKTSGPVSKVIEMFRGRSHSMTSDLRLKVEIKIRFSRDSLVSINGALLRRHSVDPDRRRASGFHRSFDGSLDHHTALIHRDHRGLPSADPLCDRIDIEDLGEDEDHIFAKFFKNYRCYDLIPISAKLVVFDTQLLVKKAFFALVQNGKKFKFLIKNLLLYLIGMLTITDFINILRTYYKSPLVHMDELEEHKIETWRDVLKEKARSLVSIEPDASLFEAIKTLIHSKVHRLPVINPNTGNVLYILTHKRILRFLFLYVSSNCFNIYIYFFIRINFICN